MGQKATFLRDHQLFVTSTSEALPYSSSSGGCSSCVPLPFTFLVSR
jgi:hypothetical protein